MGGRVLVMLAGVWCLLGGCLTLPAQAQQTFTLSGPHVVREWTVARDGTLVTTSLRDASGHEWVTRPLADVRADLNLVPTTWRVASARAPARGSLVVELTSGTATLTREYTVRGALIESHTTLRSSLPARVGTVALERLGVGAGGTVETQAYHGGSDWRNDFRDVAHPHGVFDVEAQVLRTDHDGAGWFAVSGRRGGAMARAGRDGDGTAWVGMDWARDLFDFGPLVTDPPDYNRLPNALYPVPVRGRVVRPGETLDLGRAWTGIYRGGADQAAFAFADAFARHVAPPFARAIGFNSFHPHNHGPTMSDAGLRPQVKRAAALGIERFMLDDQWQGGPGGESGDWRFDPQRFPDADHDGLPDLVQLIHAGGMQLGLWMSPAEFHADSVTAAEHPDWVCTPLGQVTRHVEDDAGLGVWDFNNPALRAHLTAAVDRLVRTYDVRELKFDFMAWLDCGTRDYLDYEDAFNAWVTALRARHPQLTIQLDETNDQRLWAFAGAQQGPTWFENGHTHGSTQVSKLIHDLWSAAPWLPPSLIGSGLLDGTVKPPYALDQLMAIGLLGHITFWSDLTKLATRQAARVQRWLRFYRARRGLFAGAAYVLTPDIDPLAGKGWTIFQPWTGRAGLVVAIRQAGGPARLVVRPRGLQAATTYVVRRAPTGRVIARRTGAHLLARGLSVTVAREQDATVLELLPVTSRRRGR